MIGCMLVHAEAALSWPLFGSCLATTAFIGKCIAYGREWPNKVKPKHYSCFSVTLFFKISLVCLSLFLWISWGCAPRRVFLSSFSGGMKICIREIGNNCFHIAQNMPQQGGKCPEELRFAIVSLAVFFQLDFWPLPDVSLSSGLCNNKTESDRLAH